MSAFEKALEITGMFEGNGWGSVSKPFDFDGQTLSCGIVQFTYNSGNMQQVVRIASMKHDFLNVLKEVSPNYGQEYVNAMIHYTDNASLDALKFLKMEKDKFRKELVALWSSPVMIEAQKEALIPIWNKAEELTRMFQTQTRAIASSRAYCLFFDILIQNGGLKGVFPWKKRPYVNDFFDYMYSVDNKDTKKNLKIWGKSYERATEEQRLLFLIGCKRAMLCRPAYIADVLNRKGTIAFNKGWVHGEQFQLG